MTEPTTEEILGELISTITVQNAELEELKAQTAKQTDTLNEVKRHSEAVRKSVSWDKLGEEVFKGVAAAVLKKIDDTTDVSEKLVTQAHAMRTTSELQKEAVVELQRLGKQSADEIHNNERAATSVAHASERILGSRRREWMEYLAVGALTACVGIFGGFWWAQGTLEKGWYAELGTELQTSSGENYCEYMKGTILKTKKGGTYCAAWISPDPKE